jgi:hypothetical protein
VWRVPTQLSRRLLNQVGLLAVLTGCAGGFGGWHQPKPALPQRFSPRQQVQVWHDHRTEVWHGVRRVRDSLSGTPYHRPLECDSCRVSLPITAIDSLRLGNLERPGLVLAALPFYALGVLVVAMRLDGGSD